MVVGLHSNFLKDCSQIGWYLTTNGLFRIAVPIFLVINGFFFYKALQSNPRAWFKRVLLLYLFWMGFYSYFWFRPIDVGAHNISRTIHMILFGYYHLWYFPGMICAAILVFLLRNFRPPLIFFIAIVSFLMGLAIQYIGNYHIIENELVDKKINSLSVYRNFLFFSFPFFSFGFLIRKTELYKFQSFKKLLFFSILTILLLLLESSFNYKYLSAADDFDILASLIIVCPTLSILFLQIELSGNSKIIAQYSTSIYLIHPIFIILINNFYSLGATINTIVVIALSLVAGYIMIKLNANVKVIL